MRPPNLADPTVEPTDEELQALAHRAFAGVSAAHQASLVKLYDAIDLAREEVLRRLRAQQER